MHYEFASLRINLNLVTLKKDHTAVNDLAFDMPFGNIYKIWTNASLIHNLHTIHFHMREKVPLEIPNENVYSLNF